MTVMNGYYTLIQMVYILHRFPLYLTLHRGIMIDVLRLWLIFRSQEPEEGFTQRLEF